MACAFRMTQKKYADLEKAGSALCEFCKAVRQENCNSCTLHEVLDSAWMEAAAEGVIDNWRITRKQDLSKKEMRIKFGMTKKKHAEIKKASSVLCKFCKAVPEKDCCGCIVQELLDSAWIEAAAEDAMVNEYTEKYKDDQLEMEVANNSVYITGIGKDENGEPKQIFMDWWSVAKLQND